MIKCVLFSWFWKKICIKETCIYFIFSIWIFETYFEYESVLVPQLCLILRSPMNCSPPTSSVHGDSTGKNTSVGCHFLLQGIFQTQVLNLVLLHCRQIIYHLRHTGNPFWIYHSLKKKSIKLLHISYRWWSMYYHIQY